ncbi:MAG: substrate-binding domain-containing protein, partial [Victivallales bacterium]|nr:substrate-binding domain-containing protein [Victivallales bacterium]
PPPWILDADPQKALEMLFDNQNRFTAVIAQDIMAIRILQEALKRQIPVPESFSVLGIDGMDAGDYTVPRLTCVCQPQAEQGAAAAELLLE